MLLIGLIGRVEGLSLLTDAAGLFTVFISVAIVFAVIRLFDNRSIVSVRRILALMVTATILWTCVLAIGVAYATITGSPSSAVGAFLFGGFLAAAFEMVVINGAFIRSSVRSVGLAVIHPLAVFIILVPTLNAVSAISSGYLTSASAGLVMFFVAFYFLRRLDTFKTKHGVTSLQLLHAFLKTWVSKDSRDLEQYFQRYSRNERVDTKIVRFSLSGKRVLLILPGIHAGPFSPVGSYNLSEVIYAKTKDANSIPMILHGVGGHERNLPTNAQTIQYAEKIANLVNSLEEEESGGIKGPTYTKLGEMNIAAMAFGNNAFVTLSSSPYNSDDVDPATISDASSAANNIGLNLSLIDAHNSIGGENASPSELRQDQWERLLVTLNSQEERELAIGYAHSSEVGFIHGLDVSDAGIGVLMISNGKSKNVLVAVDSNNARVGLRERIKEELNGLGLELVELCTSDTHNLAARSLTERGYFALGEATSFTDIVEVIKKLVRLSSDRLNRCKYVVMSLTLELPLIGSESIDDFASLTNQVIDFVKRFFKGVVPLAVVLLAITLFY